MANKKTSFKPDYFASKCGTHETFATVYDSMLTSEQFKRLSPTAKYLYVACRNQLTSKRGRETLFNHGKEFEIVYPDNCFVFPAKHLKEYGFTDRSNGTKYLNELEQAGFIRKYECNKHCKKVNVYQFTSKWREME